MKTLTIIAVLFFASILNAQSTISTQGGTIVENPNATLAVVNSPVVLYNSSSADGSVSLNTGTLASGNPQGRSATYASGGSFVVTIAGTGTIFNGTITSAEWQGQGDRNVTFYTLTGEIESLNYSQTGSFTLTTQGAPFTGSDSLSNPYSITVTLD